MGGQSFKCPHCKYWALSKGQLHSHLVGKHAEPPGFTIEGTGPHTEVRRTIRAKKED